MILDYAYPNGDGPMRSNHRIRAVEILERAQRLIRDSILPQSHGDYAQETYKGWTSRMWVQHGFSIVESLNRVPGPMFEIGGPTRVSSGADTPTWDDSFRPENFGRAWLVSGMFDPKDAAFITSDMQTPVEGYGRCGGTLAMVASGSSLPLPTKSVSAVFARAVHSPVLEPPDGKNCRENVQMNRVLHVMMIEEAYRVLRPGGLFFYHCTELERIYAAMVIGFKIEKYSGVTSKRRWWRSSFDTILAKP